MYRPFLKCLILVLVLLNFTTLSAQEKFEKESRIGEKDVPAKALQMMDSANFEGKIKWYLEEGLSEKSVEAKFRHNKVKYSVEFNTLGIIEDIEIEIDPEDLHASLRDAICNHLLAGCLNHRIVKVQIQYTGSESVLAAVLHKSETNPSPTIRYELIVRCKQENSVDLFEYLFSEEGSIISTSKIVFKNSSHLEY